MGELGFEFRFEFLSRSFKFFYSLEGSFGYLREEEIFRELFFRLELLINVWRRFNFYCNKFSLIINVLIFGLIIRFLRLFF